MANKQKIIVGLAIVLVAINLVLVGFIFFGHRRPQPGEGPRRLIIEKLGLDDAQIASYEKLIGWHRSEMKRTNDEMFKLKKDLYGSLVSEENTGKDSLISLIGHKQMEVEQINLKHFSDIRNLCRGDQRLRFDELTKEIADLFQPHPDKR